MSWTATNSEGYEAPVALAVDIVVLTVADSTLRVLALRADGGRRTLPGGFVAQGEGPERTARRKLREKTGLDHLYLEQLGAFAEPGRDDRGWIPSVAYLALVPPSTIPEDRRATWVNAGGRLRWAHDHRAILAAAIERVEGKLWWSNVAVGILSDSFSLTDARHVYECIAGTTYDAATFARDLKSTGLIEPTGATRQDGPGRPAALYRFKSSELTWGAGRRKRIHSA